MKKNTSRLLSISWLLCFSYFFILMIKITLQYIPLNSNVAFLQIKQTEISQIPFYYPIFYVHVYSAIFVLLAGFSQFSSALLKKYPATHRNIGKVYISVVLFLSAPSGFFIGLFANGGLYSKISFVTLSILWFYFTLKGFTSIKNKNIRKHRAFMFRSFALTFSAITLRFWKVILVYLFHPAPMDVYQIIAWLGWIPNLLIVEYYLYNQLKK
ncbi:putative membrane protein [Flavobacterium sp. 9]|nr:putative membrane protein [Flavobacterium sp. 9]